MIYYVLNDWDVWPNMGLTTGNCKVQSWKLKLEIWKLKVESANISSGKRKL